MLSRDIMMIVFLMMLCRDVVVDFLSIILNKLFWL